jgi:hypothetical protein
MTARIVAPKKTTAERFWEKVERVPWSGCWIWIGGCNGVGYGLLWEGSFSKKLKLAHRVSFEMHIGPIPAGLDLDHLCRVRCCVNPDHLEPVTRAVNINRGVVAQVHRARAELITHCPKGHPYDEANCYHHPNGTRNCRACGRERMRKKRGAVHNI